VGGGADAGAGLGSLIGHEYHRMMTSEAGAAFLSQNPMPATSPASAGQRANCVSSVNAVFMA